MTRRMAYLVDMDHPYITLDNNYIESVWHILDKLNKDDMIYEGHKILPYCISGKAAEVCQFHIVGIGIWHPVSPCP